MADYYQIHFQEYFKKTISLDPSGFLDPLLNRLKKGGSILDVGCGSGRDLVWLKNRGYHAIGFERSPDLGQLARNISKALKSGGWMLLSLKEGNGLHTDSTARTYYLWQKQELKAILCGLNFEIVASDSRKTALNTREVIINVLARQRPN